MACADVEPFPAQFGAFVPGLSALKHHFNVSNSYVIRKLQLVVFPWKHRSWTRKILRAADAGQSGVAAWVPPREDINSPDLYIPSKCLYRISSSTMGEAVGQRWNAG
jgi:hypothetical protein